MKHATFGIPRAHRAFRLFLLLLLLFFFARAIRSSRVLSNNKPPSITMEKKGIVKEKRGEEKGKRREGKMVKDKRRRETRSGE